jgi:hypothetical protein
MCLAYLVSVAVWPIWPTHLQGMSALDVLLDSGDAEYCRGWLTANMASRDTFVLLQLQTAHSLKGMAYQTADDTLLASC